MNNKEQTKPSFSEQYAVPYYTPCLQVLVVWAIYLSTPSPILTTAFVLIFPYLGKLLPNDSYPVLNSTQHNKNIFHVFPLVAHILLIWVSMFKLFIDYPFNHYSTFETVNALTTLAFVVSPSIDAAHQLLHRPQKIFNIIGFINMALFQFTVYPIQHLYLHHKLVGTSQDPITSPKNKNYYSYTFNAFFSAHSFVFKREPKIFLVCMLTNWAYIGAMLWAALRQYEGDWSLAVSKVGMFLLIGLICFMFFEAVQYIEHYGLVYREAKEDGKVSQICAWNSQDNIMMNWLIFRFQRHSDHHMNAYKIYTTMELTQQMPKFPFDFIEGALLSLVPPLWYYIMNPYVEEVLDKKPVEKSHRSRVFLIKEAVSLARVARGVYLALGVYLS